MVLPDHGFQSDEDIARMLRSAGLEPCEAQDAMAVMADETFLRDVGASPHAVGTTAAMSRHTWFTTESLAGAVTTKRGTLADTSLADILFSSLMSRDVGARAPG